MWLAVFWSIMKEGRESNRKRSGGIQQRETERETHIGRQTDHKLFSVVKSSTPKMSWNGWSYMLLPKRSSLLSFSKAVSFLHELNKVVQLEQQENCSVYVILCCYPFVLLSLLLFVFESCSFSLFSFFLPLIPSLLDESNSMADEQESEMASNSRWMNYQNAANQKAKRMSQATPLMQMMAQRRGGNPVSG